MFGKVTSTPQNELTRFYPRSPYAVSKVSLIILQLTIVNRMIYLHARVFYSTMIPSLRGEEFVTKKIARSMVEIKNGLRDQMLIGNIDVKRDWGLQVTM